MKTVRVQIKGVSPLLINRFKDESEIPKPVKKGKKDYGTPRDQAEQTAYVDDDTQKLWIPWSWITGCIRSVASDYKVAGSRKSVKSVSSGAVRCIEERLFFDEGYVLDDIEIDSRPAVVQRARIMRHRTKLEAWSLTFMLEVEDDILPLADVHDILADAGRRAGLGDFRIEKGGPFGRFNVTLWEAGAGDADQVIEEKPTRKRKTA